MQLFGDIDLLSVSEEVGWIGFVMLTEWMVKEK
jgi:hypothetical protein